MLTEIESKLTKSFVGKFVKWVQSKSLIFQLFAILLLAGLIAVGGYAVKNPEDVKRFPGVCKRWYRSTFGGKDIPLTKEQRERLDLAIRQITQSVHAGADGYIYTEDRKPQTNQFDGWPVAQIAMALYDIKESEPALFQNDAYPSLVDSIRDLSGAWKEYHGSAEHPLHIGGTGWVIFTKGRLGYKASDEELNFLLHSRNSERGSWPMFPSDLQGEIYGSTYATVWAALALHEQCERCKLPDQLEKKCRAAVGDAVRWLTDKSEQNSKEQKGLWKFYYDYPQQKEISLSNSGLVLHFLHHLDFNRRNRYPIAIKHFDQAWLENLSVTPPYADSFENWNLDVPVKGLGRAKFRESARCLKLPWVIIATADAYPNGTWKQRMKALEFIEKLSERLPTIKSECSEEPWMLAELLIALRQLQDGYLIKAP